MEQKQKQKQNQPINHSIIQDTNKHKQQDERRCMQERKKNTHTGIYIYTMYIYLQLYKLERITSP